MRRDFKGIATGAWLFACRPVVLAGSGDLAARDAVYMTGEDL